MAKANVSLSKRDLENLSLITDPVAQNQFRKAILAKRKEGMDRSSKAFAKLRAKRNAVINAELNVEIKTSKRGNDFIVVSGGGLLNAIWLNQKAATSYLKSVSQVKALMPQLVTDVPEVDGEDQE